MDAQRVFCFFNIPLSLIVDQSGKLHSSQVEWRIPRTRSGIYDSEQPCDQLPSPISPGFPHFCLCAFWVRLVQIERRTKREPEQPQLSLCAR